MAAAALLFDLDGTLCDSRPWYVEVFGRCFGADRVEVERLLASGVPPVRLASDCGISRTRLLRSCGETVSELPLYPGVTEALRSLGERGTPLGLVTSLSGALVDLVLDGHDLRRRFAAIVTAERGLPPKPNPTSILRALSAMRRQPALDTYYVGDTNTDADAAGRAGLSFAWAAYGYGDGRPPTATAVLECFRDVVAL